MDDLERALTLPRRELRRDSTKENLMDNLPDWVFKTFWTAVAAVLGVVVQSVADLPAWWAPLLIAAATAGLAFARQKSGTQPPATQ